MLSTSCFEEDERITPRPSEAISIPYSMYDHQVYFDLGDTLVREVHPHDSWDLGFECGNKGWHVIVNSGNLLGIYPTGSTNFKEISGITGEGTWRFDSSSGRPDSTAVGKWIDFNGNTIEYTKEVYLIGKDDGISYRPFRKIIFTEWDSTYYKVIHAKLDGSDLHEAKIEKDSSYNFVYYTFLQPDSTLKLEPAKTQWDIVFTQYYTILYTEEGIPTPYQVRGTLLNPYKVTAAKDTSTNFYLQSLADTNHLKFTGRLDLIGHAWKDAVVDESNNSATYRIVPGIHYVIIDNENNFFKLKFVSYFNDFGEKGYPRFLLRGLNQTD